MRRVLILVALAGAALTPVLASPAHAAGGDTTVTFVAGTPGGLSILPAPAVAGVTVGNAVTGAMTSVVTDLRVGGGTWSDTISATDFALVGATSPSGASLVPANKAKVFTTSVTVAVPGTATITNAHPDLANALTLSNSGQELVSAVTTNANVTTLVSTVSIDVTGKTAGAYLGTITQTVS